MDEYLIQVGKDKGAYKNRYIVSSWEQAFRYYSGLNIHSGYKKRLIRNPGGKVIARYIS